MSHVALSDRVHTRTTGQEQAFSRTDWVLDMHYLHHGGASIDPAKRQTLIEALVRDPDVAFVHALRRAAEPIPQWAALLDEQLPRYGVVPCHPCWTERLDRLAVLIGNEMTPSDDLPGKCWEQPAGRVQWSASVQRAIAAWVSGGEVAKDDAHVASDVAAALGAPTDDKRAAALYVAKAVELVCSSDPQVFRAALGRIDPPGALGETIKPALLSLQTKCGSGWENVVMTTLRCIGKGAVSEVRSLPVVQDCDAQLSSMPDRDHHRVSSTCAILLGLWAWLGNIGAKELKRQYPKLAVMAQRTVDALGEPTAAKRWLAARMFVGVRLWLAEIENTTGMVQPVLARFPQLA